MDQQQSDKKRGFVTLVTVIIIGGIATVITISLLFISADSFTAAGDVVQSTQARGLADMCAERAINQLKLSTSYTGSENISAFNGSCQIATVTGSGNTNRTIQATGIYFRTTRKVQVVISQVNPTTTISSWTEMDF